MSNFIITESTQVQARVNYKIGETLNYTKNIKGCNETAEPFLHAFDYLYDAESKSYQQIIAPDYVLTLNDSAVNYNEVDPYDIVDINVTAYGFYIMYEQLFKKMCAIVCYDFLKKNKILEQYMSCVHSTDETVWLDVFTSFTIFERVTDNTNIKQYEECETYDTRKLSLKVWEELNFFITCMKGKYENKKN